MQSRDDTENLVHTEILQDHQSSPLEERVKSLSQAIERAESKGAVSHVVAPLPSAGSTVEIHGLTYKVKYASPGRGKLVLELEKPKE